MDRNEIEELVGALESIVNDGEDAIDFDRLHYDSLKALRHLLQRVADLTVEADRHVEEITHLRNELDAQTWRPISENEAPHDEWLLLAEPPQSYETRWNLKVGKASWGQRPGERGWAGYASHWMPLPSPPSTDEEPKATPSEQQGTNDHDT